MYIRRSLIFSAVAAAVCIRLTPHSYVCVFPATTRHTRVYHPLIHSSAQGRTSIVQTHPTVKVKSAVRIRTSCKLETRLLCHFTCQQATRSSATLCNVYRFSTTASVDRCIVASEDERLRKWYLHPSWNAHGVAVIRTTFHRRIPLPMCVSRCSETKLSKFEVRGSRSQVPRPACDFFVRHALAFPAKLHASRAGAGTLKTLNFD